MNEAMTRIHDTIHPKKRVDVCMPRLEPQSPPVVQVDGWGFQPISHPLNKIFNLQLFHPPLPDQVAESFSITLDDRIDPAQLFDGRRSIIARPERR